MRQGRLHHAGPLTNLARLITEYPDVTEHIETVVSMGGGIKKGNVRPYAEFNIFCDPQAAKIVFLNVKKLALVPLNTTLTVSLNTEQINAISEETKLSSAMKKILAENYKNCVKYGEPGSTMHDSTAVLYYLCPELFETKVCGIDVNVKDRPGETEITESRSNILITTKCESGVLIDKILKSI